MPTWSEIFTETNTVASISPTDLVRRKYLEKYQELTERNIICYYSGWLNKPDAPHIDVSDADMEGFMNAVAGIDRSKGLDLFLHTPGGSISATEAIVKYLRLMFGTNIRVVVPQLAQSAGTMIACAGEEIVMGKQSSLGPIDPQIDGVPALNVIREFDEFESDILRYPEKSLYWSIRLQGLQPASVLKCIKAVELSSELVISWLSTGMFRDSNLYSSSFIESVVNKLNENSDSKLHDRHFDKDLCKSFGLRIVDLEDDQDYQDAVLSVHHAYCISLSNTLCSKIIENHNGVAVLRFSP